MKFSLELSTKIHFGDDALSKAGEESALYAGSGPVMVLTGSGSVHQNGVFQRIAESMEEAAVPFFEFPGVEPNPRVEHIRRAIDQCRKERVELVFAVGGGSCIDAAKANGYVETIFHRRRYIPDIKSPKPMVRQAAERLAINSVVQGSAADLIKQAMIRVDAKLRETHSPASMLLQIHDELVFELPPDAVEAATALIDAEMIGAIDLRVPLKVDIHIGENWMAAK